MRPGVLAIASTIDGGLVVFILVGIDRVVDVDKAIKCASGVVVAAIDGILHLCRIAAPVDVGLVGIAGLVVAQTIGATEDIIEFDGRSGRDIDDGTTCDALVEAGTIDGVNLTVQQVDDSRSLVGCGRIVGH